MMTRTLFFFLLVLTTVPALAQDKPAEEPAALVKERKAYEDKIKAAVDPITAKYLKKLDEMKKEFGGKGDLASAQAVQKEIESLTAAKGPVTLVGKWTWSGNTIEVLKDGSATQTPSFTGKWRCLDKAKRQYQVVWSHGFVDWIVISPDGANVAIKNNKGDTVAGRRLPPESKQ